MTKKMYSKFLKNRLMHRPLIATIHVTKLCNLNCIHCPPEIRNISRRDIKTKGWKEIMDQLERRGIIGLIIWGGEPMLRQDISELCGYADRKFMTSFHTNGTVSFKDIKAGIIFVSIDGDYFTNNRIRGMGTYNKAIENIKSYPDRKRVAIAFTIHSQNYMVIEKMFVLAKKLKVRIGFQSYYGGELALGVKHENNIFQQLIDYKKNGYPILNSTANLESMIKGGHKCHRWAFTSFDSKGVEYPNKCLPAINCDICHLMCFNEVNLALSFRVSSLKALRGGLIGS